MTRLIGINRAAFASVVLLVFATAAAAQDRHRALLRILLPSTDTQLEIQGVAQKPTSPPKDVRLFESPELEPGKTYEYDVKVTWTQDGKQHVRERTVKVTAGHTTVLDMKLETDKATEMVPPKPPTDLPFDKPPIDKPADKPPDKPADKPVDKPADKPVDKPADKPIDKPADKPADKPMPPSFVAPPEKVVDFMLTFAKVSDTDVVYDLGSGDGRIALAAVTKHHARKAVGIEHNADRVAEARKSATAAGGSVEFRREELSNLTEKDLANATVIAIGACTSEQIAKIAPMLQKLKAGTRVVVHGFEIPGMKYEDQREQTVDGIDHQVFLYTIK